MSALTVTVKVILRMAVAFVVGVASFIPALLVGVLGTSSDAKPFIWASGAVLVSGIGWSLLPLVRYSRTGAYVSLSVWVAFGAYLWLFFGAEYVRGWAVGPWLLASFLCGISLAFSPPKFSRSSQASAERVPVVSQAPNPSVKGTSTSGLRPLAAAPYVER
jgi:hypothetical protein